MKNTDLFGEKAKTTLYIIGNGFDLAHQIPSRYSDFYKYLKTNRQDVLGEMENFYCVNSDSNLWTDFEQSLGKDIIYDSLSEIIHTNVPNLASDDFRDRDWYDAQYYIESECEDLLKSIRSGFEEWIQTLSLVKCEKLFHLDSGSYYLTFNYTETLEKVYGIPVNQILHIHNKVGDPLIFGHGGESFNVRLALYGKEDQFVDIDENGEPISYEVGHEQFAEQAVYEFYYKMAKDTERIILQNDSFFNRLSSVDRVIVIGHSYNGIDMPYYCKIVGSVRKNAKWELNVYSENDCKRAKDLIQKLNLKEDQWNIRKCQ